MRAQEFEDALDAALLDGERLRLRVLAGVSLFLAVGLTLISLFGFDDLSRLSNGQLPRWALPAFGLAAVGVPLVALRSLDLWGSRRLSAAGAYITVAVELSLPTLLTLLWARSTPPEVVIASPIVWIYPVLISLYALRLSPGSALFAGAWGALQQIVVWKALTPDADSRSVLFLAQPNLARALAVGAMGVTTAFVAYELRKRLRALVEGQAERADILQTFGRHVSPAVVDRLLQQRYRGASELRYVAVMFLDIRGFTTLCEGRSPTDIVALLNAIFGFMIEAVNERQGFINKFLGDGFMAVFGAPVSDGRDAGNAVDCALTILARLGEAQAAGRVPETVRIGMGIHAGEAVTGSVGSTAREEYTVIGDVVNVAARIEGLNKEFGAQLLVSGEVWKAVAARGLAHEALGGVPVKGRKEPVTVYKLV